MADMNDTKLKYQIIKEYIIGLIESGELSPDEQIPSEPELSKIFNISIISVRRALFELVNEMRIYRIKGKGSFVAHSAAEKKDNRRFSDNILGFVLSAKQDIYDSSLMKMTRGIQSCLIDNGYSLVIEYCDGSLEKEKEIINRLIDDGIKGIVYYSADPDKNIALLKKMNEKKVAFVLVDRYAKNFPAYYVVSDNFGSAFYAMEYLLGMGHRKIAFVTYSGICISTETGRYEGYIRAMGNANLPVDKHMVMDYISLDQDSFVSMINNGDITAVFAINDFVAIEIMKICEKHGIGIPESLSIMGFDDIDQAAWQKTPLTSIKQYFDKMGCEAAKTLVKAIRNPDKAIRKIELSTKLTTRKSVLQIN